MTPSEMLEEQKWGAKIAPIDEKKEFLSQLEIEEEKEAARFFAAKMVKANEEEEFEADEEVGDLAEELSEAFRIIDKLIWFLREFDIHDIDLPKELQTDSAILYEEARNFIQRMEYGYPIEIQKSIEKEKKK